MEQEGIEHRTVEVNGIRMHVAEKGEGPVVLFLHGFPELWYSWRHQILFLAARGFRAVAPDLRGFGDTEAPPDIAAYSIFHIVGDIVALIDSLGQDQEPGEVEAQFAQVDTTVLMKILLTSFSPQALFIPEKGFPGGLSEELTLPYWLSENDINYFASKFSKTGFSGGINYYRNMNRNWELTAPWTGIQIKVPTKFILGDQDATYHFMGLKDYIETGGLKRDVPLLEDYVLMKGVGHFINQEKPEEISHYIYEFIKKF